MSNSFLRGWSYLDPSGLSLLTYSVTEWLRLEGTSEVILVQSPGSGEPAVCPGPHPVNFWRTPRMKTPQPSWSAWASAKSLPQWKNVFWCLDGTSCVSVYAHWLLPCHWASLRTVCSTGHHWEQSSLHLPFRYFYILIRSLWAFPSLARTVPALRAFSRMRDALVP